MATVADVSARLQEVAPLGGAEEWDNVGLLVGDCARAVTRLMTCLTLTPTTVDEAIGERAEMVVVHHPLPFRPVVRITTDSTSGRLLWRLIGAGISVYSAHTAFDSAAEGINQQWADALGLSAIEPLIPSAKTNTGGAAPLGAGRYGSLLGQLELVEIAHRIRAFLSLGSVRIVGCDEQPVRKVAIACGSGGSLLEAARAKDCDCFVSGETSFHGCLEAEANGIGLVLCGHFASERFAMEWLAVQLAQSFPDVNTWASRRERDPLHAV